MKILVTGGAGFIGKHIAHALLAEGHDVFVADVKPHVQSESINKRLFCSEVDILSAEFADQFKQFRPDVVIHHAAQTDVSRSMSQPQMDATLNITGTIALLELCITYQVKKFIFASTAAVYGMAASHAKCHHETDNPMPLSFYGLSKWTAEQYILKFASFHQLPYLILRYSNVYGNLFGEHEPAGHGVISHFIQALLKQQAPIIYGDGMQTRDFIYIKDIVRANLVALHSSESGIFNISSGLPTSIHTLYNEIAFLIGSHLKPIYKHSKMGDVRNSCLDNKKARLLLHWEPTYSIRDGLGDMLNAIPFNS